MLGQCLQRWPNIEPTFEKRQCLKESPPAQETQKHLYNIYTASAQRLRRCNV